MGILRQSQVDDRVPDLDLAATYHTEVMGLLEVERTATEVFLKCWDEPDHHSVKLGYAPRIGLDLISCGGAVAGSGGLVVEYWVADDRVFYCWCRACDWTGTVVQVDRHIGHEAAE
jgi:catechol 2,3-dioxygenase-like lactoylglutathione lyase family enzyme